MEPHEPVGPKLKETPEEKAAREAQTAKEADEDQRAAAGDADAIKAVETRTGKPYEKPAPKGDEAKPPEQAAPPADDKNKPPEGTDEEEPADDFVPPPGLKEKSGKRWMRLVDRTKQAEGTAAQWDRIFKGTGATPEVQATMLETLRLVYADGSPQAMEAALKNVDLLREHIAVSVDKVVPGVNLLQHFPELQKQVDDMQMTPEVAVELARTRLRQQRNAQRTNTQRETQAQRDANAAVEQKAVKDLDTWGETKIKNDPNGTVKIGYMRDKGIFTDIAKNFPPHKWMERVEYEWGRLPELMAKPARPGGGGGSPPQAPLQKPGEVPLRPSTSAGGGRRAPLSLEEAVDQGVEEGGRGG